MTDSAVFHGVGRFSSIIIYVPSLLGLANTAAAAAPPPPPSSPPTQPPYPDGTVLVSHVSRRAEIRLYQPRRFMTASECEEFARLRKDVQRHRYVSLWKAFGVFHRVRWRYCQLNANVEDVANSCQDPFPCPRAFAKSSFKLPPI